MVSAVAAAIGGFCAAGHLRGSARQDDHARRARRQRRHHADADTVHVHRRRRRAAGSDGHQSGNQGGDGQEHHQPDLSLPRRHQHVGRGQRLHPERGGGSRRQPGPRDPVGRRRCAPDRAHGAGRHQGRRPRLGHAARSRRGISEIIGQPLRQRRAGSPSSSTGRRRRSPRWTRVLRRSRRRSGRRWSTSTRSPTTRSRSSRPRSSSSPRRACATSPSTPASPATSAKITAETLLAWDPDIIIMNYYDVNQKPSDIYDNPVFSELKAVKNHRIFKTPLLDPGSQEAPLIWQWMATRRLPRGLRLRSALGDPDVLRRLLRRQAHGRTDRRRAQHGCERLEPRLSRDVRRLMRPVDRWPVTNDAGHRPAPSQA